MSYLLRYLHRRKCTFLLILLVMFCFSSCVTGKMLYAANYPDDPDMQNRMEKEYGNPSFNPIQ